MCVIWWQIQLRKAARMGLALEPFWEHANANKPFLKTFFATPPLRNGPLWQGANLVSAESGVLNCGSPLHSAVSFILLRSPWSRGVLGNHVLHGVGREAASGHASLWPDEKQWVGIERPEHGLSGSSSRVWALPSDPVYTHTEYRVPISEPMLQRV